MSQAISKGAATVRKIEPSAWTGQSSAPRTAALPQVGGLVEAKTKGQGGAGRPPGVGHHHRA